MTYMYCKTAKKGFKGNLKRTESRFLQTHEGLLKPVVVRT